jgi:predicted RecB family nuclease
LGQRHEAAHLGTFPQVVDLRSVDRDLRFERTVALIKCGTPVLYQPVLKVQMAIGGVDCEIVGEPDFLIHEAGSYIVRDVKMARRVEADNHPEILLQLQFYGWLYEQVFGVPPLRIEALNGQSQIVIVPPGNAVVLCELGEMVRLKRLAQSPYAAVGWTKCGACGFHDHCWPKAEAARDVALVYDVDQGLSMQLHSQGVGRISQLLDRFNATSLSELKRPWGTRMQKVGKKAGMILRRAEVLQSGRESLLQPPAIPHSDHYVMFDLEGMPPHLDELDKIYLWGMQVFGITPGEFMPAVAGFGVQGDREGWQQFLVNADSVFRQFGDIPFVHWHHYERTHINAYAERHGDPQGIAARVLNNLLDLLPITRDSILLPLSSYSLKVVEKYVGFERTQEEYGGSWSMAKYIEATETHDEEARRKLIDEVLVYNKEDLAATWAVFQWLREKASGHTSFPRG